MKTAFVCILISALTVLVRGGGGGGRGGPGDFRGILCGPGDDYGRVGQCSCTRNECRREVGPQVKGCPNTNQFLQCNGQVCTVANCTDGQVWNATLRACASCPPDMHVAANKKICVCNQGKTFEPRNKTCVACPTDSTQEADTCYCPITKAIDYKKNACKDCPVGAILTRDQECQCSSTQFFNDNVWACQNCPGEWLPKPTKRFPSIRSPEAKCTCTGINQIFDRKNVECYTCPAGTTAAKDNCQCSGRNQFFNMDKQSRKCECSKGYEAAATGAGCVRSAITIPAAASTTPTQGGP